MLNRNYNALILSSTKIIKIARFSDTLVGSAPKSWHFGQLEQTFATHDTVKGSILLSREGGQRAANGDPYWPVFLLRMITRKWGS